MPKKHKLTGVPRRMLQKQVKWRRVGLSRYRLAKLAVRSASLRES